MSIDISSYASQIQPFDSSNVIPVCQALAGWASSTIHSLRNKRTVANCMRRALQTGCAMLVVMLTASVAITGCGSRGYAGDGITGMSTSAVTIDAGQSFPFAATLNGPALVSWSTTGATCTSAACGSLSSTSGTQTTYTAPAGITSQLLVKLTAAISGTANLSVANITVNPDPVISGTPPQGVVGSAYSTKLTASGGTAPLAWSLSGALPAGLTFDSATGVISGTPTAAGTSSFTAQIIDSSAVPFTVKATESIEITAPGTTGGSGAPLVVVAGNPPAGTVGVPYSTFIKATGGTLPYSFNVIAGSLPPGLSISAPTGTISGTPTTAGMSSFTAQVQDGSGTKASAAFNIMINPAAGLTLSSPPNATVGTPYTGMIGVAGGTAPYTCLITSGTLPSGLSLGADCLVTGTPTLSGTATLGVKATDSTSPIKTGNGPVTLTVLPSALSLSLTGLPAGIVGVPYNATIGVNGGTAPYRCNLLSGTLPAGLTENSCVISGTPTAAGVSPFMVKATDSSSPVETTSGPESITITTSALTLTLSNLPGATVGVPYSATIGVSGGTPPYSCIITAGTLPAGLTETSCLISGTPMTPGTANLIVKATDSSNPVEVTSGPESLVVSPAPLSLTLTNLPNATVGTPYTAAIGVSGGTAPYNCTIVSGTLPAGLSITGCVVSGTPTVAGTVSLGVKATDSSSPVEMTTGPVGLTVLPATITLTLTSPPSATVGTPYSGTIGVNGGTAPYTCTYVSGTLPAGLTLTGCTISGTPTTAGSTTITVKGTDTSNPVATTTGPVTVTVLAATTSLTLSSPPDATVSVPYTGTIGVTGGTGPYNCTLVSGTLPAGLSLGSGCVVSGTPTTAGASTVQVQATDSATPTATKAGPVTITVLPIPKLSLTGSVPNATLGVPYTQTLLATGGIKPYSYALTAGALPAGLNLSTGGVISGTPTAVGASSFTVTVTDTEPTPQTASLPLVLLVVYPTTTTDAELVGPYAFLFQGYDDVVAGVLAYQTATVASFTADGAGVVSAGELDSNHESSNPTGNTISSNDFLGTYTLGTDNRGFLTITTLNADGTTGATATYAMTVKAPVAPATVATQADLIEFDDNSLTGTKGSGTMLAQQAAAFPAGLNGSYAFGMSGDTPCLPACTIGISAGPVASVGQFATGSAGSITGTSDANIATTNYAKAALTGSYGSADGNGRLDLSMDTANTPAGSYPTDYAVYLVSANQAFVMSTDKHSSYVLLAGTAQLQTQATFSNASLSGAFIGYENAQSNPGLLGTTLGDTLNLSTATIFRATGNTTGTCDITNVDVAGATSLVNGLTGLGSGAPILNALLGTYQSTGTGACTVANNGRGVLNYPVPNNVLTALLQLLGLSTNPPAPRELYLISPNSGYFLETGYAGLGRFEAQTGSQFKTSTLNGTFVYASQPASSLASINSSGTFTADGAGNATSTLDLNVGVGTINVLQTDQTTTSTYTLTDATAGRYLFDTTVVIYAISPGRFVLVDTNPLTTSPSISLLY